MQKLFFNGLIWQPEIGIAHGTNKKKVYALQTNVCHQPEYFIDEVDPESRPHTPHILPNKEQYMDRNPCIIQPEIIVQYNDLLIHWKSLYYTMILKTLVQYNDFGNHCIIQGFLKPLYYTRVFENHCIIQGFF